MLRFSVGFHMVDAGPWPLLLALSLLGFVSGVLGSLSGILFGVSLVCVSVASVFLVLGGWFRDIRREGAMEGMHVSRVHRGLRLGVLLFIGSEAMLFFAFFWAFFWSSLGASASLGGVWPAFGVGELDQSLAALNTGLLLSSGVAGTYGHHAFVCASRRGAFLGLLRCVALGCVFALVQALEYAWSPVWLSSGVFGSCFFVLTGFHGGHVLLGLLMLGTVILRLVWYDGTVQHLFGLELALWYWHFVDVVWLFLYVSIYLWGC
jgi:cytochrome c oxidase subunit 3